MNRWKNLSPGERIRALVVMLALLGAGYQFLLYPIAINDLQNSENMVKRRLDRIAKRTKTSVHTEADPRALARRIEKLDKELAQTATALDELETGFAPAGPGAERQRLLLEISTLARQSGVELVSIGSGDFARPAGASAGGAPAGPVVDRRLGRTLLKVSARSDYWQLLEFLDGLQELSYSVSVMRLGIRPGQGQASPVKGGERQRDAATAPAALNLSLVLAI